MPHTLDQLEAFVSSAYYDAATAGLIARGIPALKAAGAPGELISPGVRRIRGNLCNVHGKYGPCDKALSGKKPKKGRKPAKARQTPAQRAEARTQQHDQNASDVAKQMADSDTGLSPSGSKAMLDFAKGTPPDASTGASLAQMGLAEQSQDGSYRMTPTGRAVVSAMRAGDYQRTVDAISRARDASSARQGRAQERTTRQTAAQAKRSAAAAERSKRRADREAAARSKKPTKAGSGGGKKPAGPAKRTARQQRRGTASGSTSSSAIPKPEKPKPVKPEKAPAKQIAPALQTAADKLSQGAKLDDADTTALIRNGLARLNKDGELILTAAGMRATTKEAHWTSAHRAIARWEESMRAPSLHIFKDASGRWRWVAQSSTAFQDRDREIVSTKALADDCAFADETGSYGPLRWWHTPGLDLGDCDFNAMHGRVLIESGTFRSEAIARKVAQAANGLEISLGFIHLPTEPDADGVFHHIRRFERSLVPRGKASNRFTAFTVKESRMANLFTPEKIAGMKAIGFTDDDIAEFSGNATATEKTADGMLVASKADDPAVDVPMPGQRFKAANGEEYIKSPSELDPTGMYYATKAFPPKAADAEPEVEAVVEEDAIDDMPIEDEPAEGGLTLSPEDLTALGQLINESMQGIAAQIMGALDLEKKVAGHVQGMMAPYQATKDAEQAQTKEQIAALSTKVAQLSGDQPAVPYRASAAKDNVLTDATMLAAAKQLADPNGADPWADIKRGFGLDRTQ